MASYYKDSKGRWSCRFRTVENGKVVNKRLSSFATKKEAQIAYGEWELTHIDEKDKPIEITFGQLFEDYLAFARSRLKTSSVFSIETAARAKILPVFEDKVVNTLKPIDIKKWQDGISHHAYKYKTRVRTHLNTILRYGQKYYGLPNPVPDTDGFRDTELPTEMVVWDVHQFNIFLDTVKVEREKMLFTLLYYTGMRVGEALALEWSDFAKDYSKVSISKTLSEKTSDASFLITAPKTKNSIRTIDLPPFLRDLFADYRKRADEKYPFGRNKKPLLSNTYRKSFAKHITESGVPSLPLKNLRHSHASTLISNNIPITAVAARLGHTVAICMKVYAQLIKSDNERIVSTLQLNFLEGKNA